MPGEFLPPVVTTLDGEIQPLLDKLAEAKAAIKALGNTKFDIQINPVLSKQATAKTKADGKAAFSKPLEWQVESRWDMESGIRARAAAQAFAAANPIYQPVRYVVDDSGNVGPFTRGLAITAGGPGFTALPSAARPALGRGWSDNPPGWGWNAPQGNSFPWWDRGISPAQQMAMGAGSQPRAIENGFPTRFNMTAGPDQVWRMPNFTNNMLGLGRQPGGAAKWFNGLAPWGIPMAGWHAIALGALGLGAGAIGALTGAGALGAVWGNALTKEFSNAQGIFNVTQATIPPGVPDYKLLKAFGINFNKNGPLAQAQAVGNGQVLSVYGGAVALINKLMGGGNSAFANEGVNIGSWFSRTVAGLDLAKNKHPGLLANFMSTTGYDAVNVGRSFSDVGSIFGKLMSHSPGEIEWITGGLSHALGALNWALGPKDSIGGFNIGGSLLNALMMYHVITTGTDWLGRGLGAMGFNTGKMSFLNLGSNLRNIGAASLEKMGLGQIGGMAVKDELGNVLPGVTTEAEGLAGALGGIGGPAMFGVAVAATALGLLVYHLVNTKDKVQIQIAAINQSLGNLSLSKYNQSMSSYNSQALSAIGHLAATQTYMPASGGAYSRFGPIGPGYGSNGADIMRWANQFLLEGQNQNTINQFGAALNARMHLGSAAAGVTLAGEAGITLNQLLKGGTAKAIQAVLNFVAGNRILNGSTGEALMNIRVGQTVNDSAWKQASQINANWDSYMGAITSGGQGLNSLYTALVGSGKFSPASALASTVNAKVGLIPTAAAVQSAGQPLLDFFRQAQSVGAIGATGIKDSFLQVAGSMIPLAGNSKTAQAMLVALAKESGVNVKNFGQLKAMTGGAANAEKNLTHSVANTMLAMTRLGPFAAQVMQDIQKNTEQAYASLINKSPAAKSAFMSLMGQIAQGTPTSQAAEKAIGILATYLHNSGQTAQQVAGFFNELHINIDKIPANIRKKLHIDTNANEAAQAFANAAAAWAGVPNGQTKTDGVFINSNAAAQAQWVQNALGVHHGRKHRALGVRDEIMAGWSWVGERGPELAYLPSGSHVIPAHRTGQTVAAAMSAMHGAGGGDIHIYIDGKEVFGVLKSRTYGYNTVNGNRRGDGRPRGTMVPRG